MGQGKHMHISVCNMTWHFSQACTMLLQPPDTKHFKILNNMYYFSTIRNALFFLK